ncbi:hypothetical protein G3M48_003599 [Beauveria asiatica]|uniref:Protein CAP22 n=1 Tax=Beauveria asiatica TaxID=1069075 RepID=A0AAW0RVT6_9HYPO
MRHTSTIALAIAQLVLAASAQIDLDMGDVPTPCKTICRPIGTLSDRCDIDLRNDNDRDERLLQNQCICTNKSFDVGKIAALCADCMHQTRNNRHDNDNRADSDDLRDIDELLSVCGFSSTTYNSAATSEVASVTVHVTRPTDVNQLTTTIDRSLPATGGAGGGSNATATSSASRGSSSGTTTVTSQSSATAAQTSGSGGSSSSQSASASSSGAAASSTTGNAAAAVTAQAAYAVGGLIAAAYLMG